MDEDAANKKPPARRGPAIVTGRKPCAACGGTDHQRTTSHKCRFNTGQRKQQPVESSAEARANTESKEAKAMADEMDRMDTLELNGDDDDSADFYSAASEFS